MRDAFDMALLSFHIPLFRLILPQRLEPLAYHRIRIVGFQSNSGFGASLIYISFRRVVSFSMDNFRILTITTVLIAQVAVNTAAVSLVAVETPVRSQDEASLDSGCGIF